MRAVRARLTFANVVSVVALFVALGGSAWAISANSVGSKQIKRGAVKKADLGANAVSSEKVADGSLLAGDFAAAQLPAGERGATGPQGPQGPQGTQGLQGQQGDAAPGQASPITFSGVDFTARDPTNTQLNNAGAGAVFWAVGSGIATAKVNLPDGAAITKIDFYGIDNSSGQLTFRLDSFAPALGTSTSHGTVSSIGATSPVRTFTLTPTHTLGPIDNQGRSYEMGASSDQTGASEILYGARVFFTLP